MTTHDTEKQDKRLAQRRWRVAVKQALRRCQDPLPELREVSNVWSFDKDGKKWWWGWPERRPKGGEGEYSVTIPRRRYELDAAERY